MPDTLPLTRDTVGKKLVQSDTLGSSLKLEKLEGGSTTLKDSEAGLGSALVSHLISELTLESS